MLIGITRPGGGGYTTAVTYDTSNRVTGIGNSAEVVGPSGHGQGQWGYSYSTSGGSETVVAVDPNGDTRTVISTVSTSLPSSDTDGRLTRVTQPETNYVVYGYDARGNATVGPGAKLGVSGTITTTSLLGCTFGS